MTLSNVWTVRGTQIYMYRCELFCQSLQIKWRGTLLLQPLQMSVSNSLGLHVLWEDSCSAGASMRLGNGVPPLMEHQGCQHWCEEQKVAALLRVLCRITDVCPQSASERPQKLQPAQLRKMKSMLGCVGWGQSAAA